MRIALVQQHATRHKAANIARGLASLEAAARGGAEVVAFAELAFEWFYPQRPAGADPLAQAEPLEGPLVSAFQEKARELGVVVVLNLYERDGAHAYDSSPVIDADGTLLGVTRMVHITDYPCFHEQGYYTPGDTGAPVYHTRAGRIGVAICYDRHFPEYMRALAIGGADVVVVPQAGAVDEWPEGLYDAEMRVSAFQNGYFVALCNRVGQEDRLEFAGESFVCDPGGQVVARAPRGSDHVLHADLDLTECDRSSARRLFLRHRRPELYAAWTAGQRGGCLAVESTEGQDTAFRVHVPRAADTAAPAEERRVDGRGVVLVAEDDPSVRMLVTRTLTRRGYTVLEAGDGREAFELAERHAGPIDVLVTDVMMPRMGGKELAASLSGVRPDTHVLFITGHVDRDGSLPTPPGADVLTKPFTADDLVARIAGIREQTS